MERLTSLYKESSTGKSPTPKIFIATLGDTAAKEGLTIANHLRSQGSWVEIGYAGSSLKSQLRRADRLSSQYVLILGDDELAQGKAKWKRLDDGTQGEVSLKRIAEDFLAGQSE